MMMIMFRIMDNDDNKDMVRDGEEGYPGDVLYNVRYSLDDQGGVRIDFTGVEEDDLNDGAHGDDYNQAQ